MKEKKETLAVEENYLSEFMNRDGSFIASSLYERPTTINYRVT